MKLELKPALQATLFLVLWGGVIGLMIVLPPQVLAAVILPPLIGCLWFCYTPSSETETKLLESERNVRLSLFNRRTKYDYSCYARTRQALSPPAFHAGRGGRRAVFDKRWQPPAN